MKRRSNFLTDISWKKMNKPITLSKIISRIATNSDFCWKQKLKIELKNLTEFLSQIPNTQVFSYPEICIKSVVLHIKICNFIISALNKTFFGYTYLCMQIWHPSGQELIYRYKNSGQKYFWTPHPKPRVVVDWLIRV